MAVDLPGYGGSAEPTEGEALSTTEKGELIAAAAAAFHLRRPVLVAASMSGAYAFPLLRDNPAAVGGFVGVAPVAWAYTPPLLNLSPPCLGLPLVHVSAQPEPRCHRYHPT